MERIQEIEIEGDLGDTAARAWNFARRRRWWIFLPARCVALLSAALLPHLPKSDSSEAVIVLVRPQVSSVYVPFPIGWAIFNYAR